jgi:four helix bundle protein
MKSDNSKKKYDLDERLIEFAVLCITISENLTKSKAGTYIGQQLLRSSTSPALHYGEAQSSESPNDFIHKMRVVLKELRETMNALRLIKRRPLIKNTDIVDSGLDECNQLISIFVASINTAQNNNKKK